MNLLNHYKGFDIMNDNEKKMDYCKNKCKANKLNGKHCEIYIKPRPLNCEYLYIGNNGMVYPLDMPDDIIY